MRNENEFHPQPCEILKSFDTMTSEDSFSLDEIAMMVTGLTPSSFLSYQSN